MMNKNLLFLSMIAIFTTNMIKSAENNNKYKELNPLIGAEWSESKQQWTDTSGMIKPPFLVTEIAATNSYPTTEQQIAAYEKKQSERFARQADDHLQQMREERNKQRELERAERKANRQKEQGSNKSINKLPLNTYNQMSEADKIAMLNAQLAKLESDK